MDGRSERAIFTNHVHLPFTLPDGGYLYTPVGIPSDKNALLTYNTSGVLNPKICHVNICIAHHFCVSENFIMHSLKQVYFYVYMC